MRVAAALVQDQTNLSIWIWMNDKNTRIVITWVNIIVLRNSWPNTLNRNLRLCLPPLHYHNELWNIIIHNTSLFVISLLLAILNKKHNSQPCLLNIFLYVIHSDVHGNSPECSTSSSQQIINRLLKQRYSPASPHSPTIQSDDDDGHQSR